MEGPSLYLAANQLQPFTGQFIKQVSGNTKIGKERLLEKRVREIFSWGKHLVFQFDEFATRVHFMLFGTFEATINGKTITGDYKRTYEPRLSLKFENGEILMFNCSIKFLETRQARQDYDFTIDIMSKNWDSKQALKKVLENHEEEVADILLDQDIFAGVGNIIKNEVLSLVKVNPKTKINTLSKVKLQEIVDQTHLFSDQFYEWRKQFMLLKHLQVHRKASCPHCQHKLVREKTGKRQRWSYFCPICQPVVRPQMQPEPN